MCTNVQQQILSRYTSPTVLLRMPHSHLYGFTLTKELALSCTNDEGYSILKNGQLKCFCCFTIPEEFPEAHQRILLTHCPIVPTARENFFFILRLVVQFSVMRL